MPRTKTRRPGRRPAPSLTAEKRHLDGIKAALKEQAKLERDLKKAKVNVARRCDSAMNAGVETQKVAKLIGVSRQMLYRNIRELVIGIPMSEPMNGRKGRK